MTKIGLKDQIKIQLKYFDDTIIGDFSLEGHTWTTDGLNQIRHMIITGALNQPTDMQVIGTNTIVSADDFADGRDDTIALHQGSWSTALNIENIGTIRLLKNAVIYAETTCTPFSKDTDTALIIQWRSTIAGDWTLLGKQEIARFISGTTGERVHRLVMQYIGGKATLSPGYDESEDKIAIWECTFTTGDKSVDAFLLQDDINNIYSSVDVDFYFPSDIDLRVVWRTTFNPS